MYKRTTYVCFFILLLSLSFSITPPLQALDFDFSGFDDTEETYAFDPDTFSDLNFTEDIDFSSLPTRAGGGGGNWGFVFAGDKQTSEDSAKIDDLGISVYEAASLFRNTLSQNLAFYKHTYPLRTRNILTYPFATPHTIRKTHTVDIKDYTFVYGFTGYFNFTPKKYFTSQGTTLGTYFVINDDDVIDFFQQAQQATKFNIGESLQYLSVGRVEERRAGLLAQIGFEHPLFTITGQIPFIYQERNLFFTDKEKEDLYNSELVQLYIASNGIPSEDDEWTIATQHFIYDQLGFGDIKLQCTTPIYQSTTSQIDGGFTFIIPTATPLAQGIIGTYHETNDLRPAFNIEDVDPFHGKSLASTEKELLVNFFLSGVDTAMSTILTAPLGNEHFGFGLSSTFRWNCYKNWIINSDYTGYYQVPKYLNRVFAIQYDTTVAQELYEEIYGDIGKLSDEQNQKITNFINTTVYEVFFPYVYQAKVSPGIILNSVTSLHIPHNTWDFVFGYNFYWQTAESLSNINGPVDIVSRLNLDKATRESSSQFKLFIKCDKNIERARYNLRLSLYADYTIMTTGIGNDLTAGLQISYTF